MQEKSLIKENILKVIEYKGITKYEFYKLTGITRGVLDQNNGMSESNIARFLAYYSEINPEWLIMGIGEMLKGINQPISLVQESKPLYTARKQTGNDDMVDKLLNRLEQQSEEIGKLKSELEIYKRGGIPGAMDAGVAVAN